MKCLSPQNTFGVSEVNSVAGKSNTIEVTVDHFFKQKEEEKNMSPYCCCGVIQVSVSPDIQIQICF